MTIDPWNFWKLGDESPEEVISFIRNDVHEFLEMVIKEYSGIMILEGRKASFLISHRKTRLEEEGFSMPMLQYNDSDNSFFHGPLDYIKSAALLTDSIHHGNHMKRSITYLSSKGIEIDKIFSYLTAKEGLEAVCEMKAVGHNQIYSHNCVTDKEKYSQYSGKLHAYFKSRIEPMDTEIPYDLYNIGYHSPKKELSKILRDAVTFDNIDVLKNPDPLFERLPKNMWEVGFNLEMTPLLKELLDIIAIDPLMVKPMRMNVHFKIRENPNSVDLTVIPEGYFSFTKRFALKKHDCPLPQLTYCPIRVDQRPGISQSRCSACLAEFFSIPVFINVYKYLNIYYNKKKTSIVRSREYRPFLDRLKALTRIRINENQ